MLKKNQLVLILLTLVLMLSVYYIKTNDSSNNSNDDLQNNVNGENKITNSEIPSNTDYSNLTTGDLYYLLEHKSENMTAVEVEKLKEEISKREMQEQKDIELSKVSQPKQYILDIQKPFNGFTSLMTLALITTLYGIGFVIYLYIMIK